MLSMEVVGMNGVVVVASTDIKKEVYYSDVSMRV